jgi:hypothetical protein
MNRIAFSHCRSHPLLHPMSSLAPMLPGPRASFLLSGSALPTYSGLSEESHIPYTTTAARGEPQTGK